MCHFEDGAQIGQNFVRYLQENGILLLQSKKGKVKRKAKTIGYYLRKWSTKKEYIWRLRAMKDFEKLETRIRESVYKVI